MKVKYPLILVIAFLLAALIAGRWSTSLATVNAAAGESPQIDVRQIGADSSLVVYYPSQKKLFVYQPFAGRPTWDCAYSIQLTTPGGPVDRKPCGVQP